MHLSIITTSDKLNCMCNKIFIMKMFLLISSISYFLFVSASFITAQNATPMPITGSFTFPDFSITNQADMNTYLDGMKSLNIDTIIWGYSGVVYKEGDCSGPYIEDNFFSKNDPNFFSNGEKLLQSIHDKGLSVYVGLAGTWNCVNFASGSISDPNTDAGRIIDFSRRLIQEYKNLCTAKGWDCNFIKGFYIPEETNIGTFHNIGWFYKGMADMIRNQEPNKKIIISPYQLESIDYEETYDDVYYLIQDVGIDIVAPQDSMGTKLVTSLETNQQHFTALHDAVRDANAQLGKSAQAWANVESFTNCVNSICEPPDYQMLKQQMQTVDGLVSKTITFIYSWSFATEPFLNNSGAQYTPAFAAARAQLRARYISDFLPDTSPVPSPTPGDLNNDGTIDMLDHNIVLQEFYKNGSQGWIPADINKDGIVDIWDYNKLVELSGD